MRPELTSSASSPARGCGSADPPGAAWCPAVQPSFSGTSSSAAARSAAHPHCRPGARPTATHTHKHTHSRSHFHFHVDAAGWTSSDGGRVRLYLPLQVPFGLLLRLQLVVKLLLQFLFDKVHLTDRPVVLDSPFASWGEEER